MQLVHRKKNQAFVLFSVDEQAHHYLTPTRAPEGRAPRGAPPAPRRGALPGSPPARCRARLRRAHVRARPRPGGTRTQGACPPAPQRGAHPGGRCPRPGGARYGACRTVRRPRPGGARYGACRTARRPRPGGRYNALRTPVGTLALLCIAPQRPYMAIMVISCIAGRCNAIRLMLPDRICLHRYGSVSWVVSISVWRIEKQACYTVL